VRTVLGDVPLIDAAVRSDAPFREGAVLLADTNAAMIAVVDAGGRVVGFFGTEEVLRGLLPRYLTELRHTAFAADNLSVLVERAHQVWDDPIERHMVKPVTIDTNASAMHVGELFLHTRVPAVAVVEEGRFVGILERREFARALTRRAAGDPRA
jgi:CBS domain-containing protein